MRYIHFIIFCLRLSLSSFIEFSFDKFNTEDDVCVCFFNYAYPVFLIISIYFLFRVIAYQDDKIPMREVRKGLWKCRCL